MNLMSMLLLNLLLFTNLSMADEANTSARPYYDNWGIGAALGVHQSNDMYALNVNSPIIFSVAPGKWSASDFSFYLDVGILDHRNMPPAKDETKLRTLSSGLAIIGMEARKETAVKSISTYSKLGVAYLSPNSNLSKKSDQVGGNIGFGVEFLAGDYKNALSGQSHSGAFFVEYDLLFGFHGADKLAGEPDLFNGGNISIGSRMFF